MDTDRDTNIDMDMDAVKVYADGTDIPRKFHLRGIKPHSRIRFEGPETLQ
jgi:hypothetical protein